jgi:hypothetical protein
MTPKKLKLQWGPTFFLSGPNFSAEMAGKSCRFIDKIFRITVIDTFSRMDGNCIASSVKLLYLGILYLFICAGKFFFWFFYRFIGEKNFGQQNCIALFDFFLKNCVSVSL